MNEYYYIKEEAYIMRSAFEQFLHDTSKEVESWPSWKKDCLDLGTDTGKVCNAWDKLYAVLIEHTNPCDEGMSDKLVCICTSEEEAKNKTGMLNRSNLHYNPANQLGFNFYYRQAVEASNNDT